MLRERSDTARRHQPLRMVNFVLDRHLRASPRVAFVCRAVTLLMIQAHLPTRSVKRLRAQIGAILPLVAIERPLHETSCRGREVFERDDGRRTRGGGSGTGRGSWLGNVVAMRLQPSAHRAVLGARLRWASDAPGAAHALADALREAEILPERFGALRPGQVWES